jgi:hypothetical protein
MRQAPLGNLFRAVGTVAAALLCSPARAEGWRVAAPDLDAFFVGPEAEVGARGGYAAGLVPEFRSGARSRAQVGGQGEIFLADRVRLSAEWSWLWDHAPALDVSGPGDVRLGTAVRLWSGGGGTVGLGWEVKLPDAADEAELGTDETDVLFGAWGGWTSGPWSVGAAAGLGVYGNPLRFANQDDVPLARVEVAFAPGAWRAELFGRVDVPTARNPARAEAGGLVRVGGRWFAEAEGAAGLTPAAADARVILRLGCRFPLPAAPGRE